MTKVDTRTPEEPTIFQYDARDRLVQVTQDQLGVETILGQYDYNHDDDRIRHRHSDRGDVDYYYDDGAVLEERNAADESLLAYYQYADRLLALVQPQGTQFYHHDALGSTVGLTDASGNAKKSYHLDPWGNIRWESGTSDNRHIFTGHEHDKNTGLVYFGARYYDPETGRFITQDTYLGDSNTPPSLHRYLYAYSNPTVFLDPTGNEVVYNTKSDTWKWVAYDQVSQEDWENPDVIVYGGKEEEWFIRNRGFTNEDQTGTHVESIKGEPDYDKVIEHDLIVQGVGDCTEKVGYLYWKSYRYDSLARSVEKEDPELANQLREMAEEYRSRSDIETLKNLGKQYAYTGVTTATAPYEIGVATGETITGIDSGAHVSQLEDTVTKGSGSQAGRKLSSEERLERGVVAAIGWATLGLGKYLEFKSAKATRTMARTTEVEAGAGTEAVATRGQAQQFEALSESGRLIDPADTAGKLTRAGRALQKHGGRQGTAFPAVRGNPSQINKAGQQVLDDILKTPGSITRSGNRFGGIDVISPSGRGARFDANGVFRGFLEP